MKLLVKPDGTVRAIYDEAIDLGVLGRPTITRASHVEPDDRGRWHADLTPVDGPVLGPFDHRSEALDAEREWLERHWLSGTGLTPLLIHHHPIPFSCFFSTPTHPARPPSCSRSWCAPAMGCRAPGVGGTGAGPEGDDP